MKTLYREFMYGNPVDEIIIEHKFNSIAIDVRVTDLNRKFIPYYSFWILDENTIKLSFSMPICIIVGVLAQVSDKEYTENNDPEEIVRELNREIYFKTVKKNMSPQLYYNNMGESKEITFLDQSVWHSDDDKREWIDKEHGVREDLSVFVRNRVKDIIKTIGEIIL